VVGEDCDGGLGGAGEFEFHVWVQGMPLVSRGSQSDTIKLNDGEVVNLGDFGIYRVSTGGTLNVTFEATEWDVAFFADSRMDHYSKSLFFRESDFGRFTIYLGEPGCNVRFEMLAD
jgi:hypothetical protein